MGSGTRKLPLDIVEQQPQYIVADTTALVHLTKVSEHSRAYERIRNNRRLAISFQTPPELEAYEDRYNLSEERRKRIDALVTATLRLPHQQSTDTWYARVAQRRVALRKLNSRGGSASDADVWIISSALEHGLPLMSHDAAQVLLARAMQMQVYTNLPDLRDENPA